MPMPPIRDAVPGKWRVDQLGREADGLEDLRARVGLDRRDPHLRDRLEQALGDALDDAVLGLVDAHAVGQPAVLDQLGERLEHHVRVDRRRAVADQRREVVDLARLAGLEHEAGLQARALAHEVVVDGGDRQQRRDRHAVGADVAVGEDEDVDPAGDRLRRLARRRARRRAASPSGPGADRPGDVERVRLEDRRVDLAQLLELVRAQDRRVASTAGARARASRRTGCAPSRRRRRRSSRSTRGSGRSAGS